MSKRSREKSEAPSQAGSEAARQFAEEAEQRQVGLAAEFYGFLVHNKKWWLTPIILILLAGAILAVVGGGSALPFIYPLF